MNREPVGRPMEILLVEDSMFDARLAIEGLRAGGVKHRLTLVCDGEEAMQFLRREGKFARAPRPDLILLDLNMPKKDGREVLAEIRQDPELQSLPVVVLTASPLHEEILRDEMLQVESYITKPVNMEKFVAVVKQLKRFWLADVILPAAAG
jgi:CheY-like chemotaxis protein